MRNDQCTKQYTVLCPDKIVGKGAEKLLFSKFLGQYICSTCMHVHLKRYNT